jgi:lipoprotein
MRKILVAISCLFFLGACSQKDEGVQSASPENRLELAVRSGESTALVDMPASVYDLSAMGSEGGYEPKYFARGEKISFKELTPGEYTFFVLGNRTEEHGCWVSLDRDDMKTILLRWEHYVLPELFGGIVKVNGANESETVDMIRLVGGVTVNVASKNEYSHMVINLIRPYTGRDTIWVNDYAIVPQYYNSYDIEEGTLIYCFPESTPVRGEIVAYDESGHEYYFEFASTKCIERNKKLELNITLERTSPLARSGNVKNTVTCFEKVSDL